MIDNDIHKRLHSPKNSKMLILALLERLPASYQLYYQREKLFY